MISVSNNFKTEITKPRTIDGKVIVGNRTLTSSQVNYIRRVFNTSLFKTILKQVEIDSNEPIDKGETVNPQFGLLINNSFEYVSLGSYKAINKPILNKDTNSYQISSCDKIVESMVSYALTTSDITYPCSVRQLFVAIFTKLGWATSGIPSTFTNSTSIIEEDVYSNVNFTYRDVLDELCTISCMFLVDKGNPTLIQKTTTNETINEQFMKSTNVAVKEKVFFNSLVFSRAEGSDNIYRKDDTSIATNGLHEFKVSDLQILSLNWRDNFINAMWNYIKTFEYYSYEIDTYGIIYLEPVDLFTISTFGDTYNTILLNSDLTIGNGVSEKIYADTPKETTTEYQYATDTDRKLNQTYLIVDKQQGQISAVVHQVDEIEQDLSNPTNTLTGQYFDIDNALDEPLVDFSMEGQTEQDSTTGKNLLSLNNLQTQTSNGVTFTPIYENGKLLYINLNGTCTANTNYYLRNNVSNVLVGNYSDSDTLKMIGTGTETIKIYANNYIFLYGANGQITNPISNPITWITYQARNGETYNNVKLYPMICKNSESNDYEPYTNGPAPNPNYPIDIHCVSGDNTIKITGKNLCNGTEVGAFNSNGEKVSGSQLINKDIIPVRPNTTYIISNNGNGCGINILSYKANKTYIGTNLYSAGRSFTTSNETYYINFWRANNLGDNLKIQLEQGNTITSYIEHQEQSQLISLGDIKLCRIGNYKDYIHKQDNRWYLHKEIGKLVLNGSESWKKYSGTKRFYIENFTQALAPVDDTIAPKIISNYYRTFTPNQTADQTKNSITLDKNHNLVIRNVDYNDDTVANFKTWLSTHNTIVYYILETPQDIEIAGTLLEQLNRLMTLPLYKNMTHITIEPNDLTPIMNIEYVRDTAINSQFVRQPQLNSYYTKTETTAQIQIGNASIKQDVTEIQTTLDNNGNAISSLSSQVQTLQSSTSLQINAINTQLENGVEKLTNSLVKIDVNGINTSKDNETFNTQITNKTFEVKDGDNRMGFMGFDTDKQKMLVEFPEMQTQKLTNAYHTTEKITEDGLKWSADFYVGDDN